MALPVAAKTWTWIANQRSSLVSVVQSQKDVMFGYKTGFLSMTGASVKGSSVGATTSMDAVDRWTSASALGAHKTNRTTTATTWIVVTMANMGGAEVLFAYVDPTNVGVGAVIMFSPAAGFTVSTTQCPTAADEVNINTQSLAGYQFTSSTAAWDRIWNFGYSSDGSACAMSALRAGTVSFIAFIQTATSAVVSPATFSPSIIGFSGASGGTITNSFPTLQGSSGSWGGNARVFNGTSNAVVALMAGAEAYGNSGSIQPRMTFYPELQGGGFVFPEISMWSETGTSRGKVCNVIDVWVGPAIGNGAYDGVTYPDDNTRQFIQWGPLVFKWNGSIAVTT